MQKFFTDLRATFSYVIFDALSIGVEYDFSADFGEGGTFLPPGTFPRNFKISIFGLADKRAKK